MICYITGTPQYTNFTTLTVNEKISHIEIKFAEDIKVTTKFDVL